MSRSLLLSLAGLCLAVALPAIVVMCDGDGSARQNDRERGGRREESAARERPAGNDGLVHECPPFGRRG